MAIELKPTGGKYQYQGHQCTIFSLPDLGQDFALLLQEAVQHTNRLGRKGIVFLDMNEIPFKLPFDFALCDKSDPDHFVIIIDCKQAYLFHLAHELAHLLPRFYDIDKWRVLSVEGKPIENWPLFAKCVRRIEHLLSDVHVDAEVIRRGFSIEDHFLEQSNLVLPHLVLPLFMYDGEDMFDFFDKLRLAANYLQCKYQLDAASRCGPVDTAFKERLSRAEQVIRVKWPTSFGLAYLINELIAEEEFLGGFDQTKFGKIGEKAMVMLSLFGVRGPTVVFD